MILALAACVLSFGFLRLVGPEGQPMKAVATAVAEPVAEPQPTPARPGRHPTAEAVDQPSGPRAGSQILMSAC